MSTCTLYGQWCAYSTWFYALSLIIHTYKNCMNKCLWYGAWKFCWLIKDFAIIKNVFSVSDFKKIPSEHLSAESNINENLKSSYGSPKIISMTSLLEDNVAQLNRIMIFANNFMLVKYFFDKISPNLRKQTFSKIEGIKKCY